MKPAAKRLDPRRETVLQAWRAVTQSPMFSGLSDDPTHSGLPTLRLDWVEDPDLIRARGYARVRADGLVVANKQAPLALDEWRWVFAHCALHLGFGHLEPGSPLPDAHLALARCVAVARFQNELRLGHSPMLLPELPKAPEEPLAERWRVSGIPADLAGCSAGGSAGDVDPAPVPPDRCVRPATAPTPMSWPDRLAIGLGAAAASAVADAGRLREPAERSVDARWERARQWFVSSYPLLGGLAAGFTLVSSYDIIRRLSIGIAAVDPALAEIYVNPFAQLTAEERRFVIAHEMLHAALRHADRVGPRDPYLWNVATDYVINGWLVEMRVGDLPEGVLFDPLFQGAGAEEVYDLIARDLRRLRRLGTLRGRGLGDVLSDAAVPHRGTDLDDFYRRALATGLAFHESHERGSLPAGLVEEIRALDQPPLPWDAQLARWFEEHVRVPERRRTYARASRRQSATPRIPRPGWHWPEEEVARSTFGVVLDTSGSMDRTLLGKALGAIASYATARDVPAARVVFCDAAAYDAGYLPVADIAGRVRVKGRGGTQLQPGVRLLERAEDFPPDAPILVITDGECDPVRVRRTHAFLMPASAQLPFPTRAPVFRLQ
ncbi:VWA-like domain-containing protein [Dactylosporangium fulvum]|uniref:VWA-like domain-containing protein n=1 Tax=Dactylosporangium fulvum TaxID=53359 RepID=A0ABY5W2W9_9ACTN|nr:VWA-like domain-containing protein [Dactylosporangium fulvum]UWP83784.1 VWA-like domain-containing protein [Dactylosporangium fulvum]